MLASVPFRKASVLKSAIHNTRIDTYTHITPFTPSQICIFVQCEYVCVFPCAVYLCALCVCINACMCVHVHVAPGHHLLGGNLNELLEDVEALCQAAGQQYLRRRPILELVEASQKHVQVAGIASGKLVAADHLKFMKHFF